MKQLFPLALIGALFLVACSSSDDKEPLPGERVSVLDLQRHLEPENDALNAQGFIAPQAWQNEFWPQAGGYPNHAMQHVAVNENDLAPAWSKSIGRGATKSLPLTTQPIVVDGRIFTIDTQATLSAFSVRDGAMLWQVDVKDPAEDDPVIGGGIAYSRGKIYVTNGYDEALAVSPDNGGLIWRVRLPAPSRAAPTIVDERVFVTTLDNRVLALNAADGSQLWEFTGVTESAGLVGAASPAASSDIVVPAFSSGEIFALRVENGSVAWADNLSSFGAAASGLGSLSDIRGLPVLDKGIVIAVSFGGRIAAIDERTGTRIWQRDIGSSETPWVAGNYLFVLSTENELVALGRDNGMIRWVTKLPRFKNEEKRKDPLFWTAPVLAGNRLVLAGSNGEMVEVSPVDGTIIRHTPIGKSVSIDPVVAGGTLYLLADDGTLMAFR